ncbi:hypothetical protein [Flavihumibacter profundi]|uniref:hypothetical protein n=1 Tax=Flavihumibacter profundi TaxID=2716883 RepID=UPI001CC55CA2|nr:hypothetical protein [Flavihumibacter profundi]MBZ5856769.1 hypothetical protein [Flavihumibacter profundi]
MIFFEVTVTTNYIPVPLDDLDLFDWDVEQYEYSSNFFIILEPGIQVEFNLLKWMRFRPGFFGVVLLEAVVKEFWIMTLSGYQET